MRRTRTVRNIHQRIVQAPAETVGALVDRLATPDDPLFPTPVWPAMVLDRPLAVGADGGHGRVRYRVAAYEPGRSVRFDTTDPGIGEGHHRFDVEPLGPDSCRVVHVLELTMGAGAFALWKLAIQPVHDTMVEETFDNAERAALGRLPHPPPAGRPAHCCSTASSGRGRPPSPSPTTPACSTTPSSGPTSPTPGACR